MDSFYFVIALTLVGFLALAAALLVPVYFFLKKEEKVATLWTEDYLEKSGQREELSADIGSQAGSQSAGNGKSSDRLPVG